MSNYRVVQTKNYYGQTVFNIEKHWPERVVKYTILGFIPRSKVVEEEWKLASEADSLEEAKEWIDMKIQHQKMADAYLNRTSKIVYVTSIN
jgi:hypothetical protein